MQVSDAGAISRKAIAPFDDGHLVVTQDNIHVFNGFGFIRPAPGEKIKKWFFDNLNWEARGTVFAKAFPGRSEIGILLPTGSDTAPKDLVIWNYKDDTWTKHKLQHTTHSLMNFTEAFAQSQPMSGIDSDVMKFFNGTTDNGTVISAYWRSKLHDFRELSQPGFNMAIQNKTVRKVEWDIATASPQPKVQVGTTMRLKGTISYDTAQLVIDGDTDIQKTDHQKTGRFITFKMTNDGGTGSFQANSYIPYLEPRGSTR